MPELTDALARREGESDFDYHRRLVYGKLVDKTLADYDYTELSNLIYGKEYSADVARRLLYGSCKTLQLLDEEKESSVSDIGILKELDAKKIELQKERQRFFDQRVAYNKVVRDRAREEELNDIIRSCVSAGTLPKLNYEGAPELGSTCGNTLLVSLNDIHYGASIHNAWCKYDTDICADMMRSYLDRIIRIGDLHRSEDCVVWAAGDEISGNIHRSIQVSNKENVIEQIMGVSELIAEFIAELSKHFRSVRFVSVAGNHSRLEANKDNAITGERLDNLVEWYLAARLQNFENVIIDDTHKLDNTMSLFSIRGKNYCMVHGDFDGSYGKVQSLQTMVGVPLYAVLSGHKHHNQTDEVQGVKTIMAGSFQGMDQFCVEKRIVGRPEQLVCVCDENGVMCHYDIPLQ